MFVRATHSAPSTKRKRRTRSAFTVLSSNKTAARRRVPFVCRTVAEVSLCERKVGQIVRRGARTWSGILAKMKQTGIILPIEIWNELCHLRAKRKRVCAQSLAESVQELKEVAPQAGVACHFRVCVPPACLEGACQSFVEISLSPVVV